MLSEESTLAVAAQLTVAAIYIHIVQPSARLPFNDCYLLAAGRPASRRGYMMQASFAIFVGSSGPSLFQYLRVT